MYPCGGRDWLILFGEREACIFGVILLLCKDFKISLFKLVDGDVDGEYGFCFFNVFVFWLYLSVFF